MPKPKCCQYEFWPKQFSPAKTTDMFSDGPDAWLSHVILMIDPMPFLFVSVPYNRTLIQWFSLGTPLSISAL